MSLSTTRGSGLLLFNELHATIRVQDQSAIVDPQLAEAYQEADKQLLNKLWLLINSAYIEILDYQTQQRNIRYQDYNAHISEYLELRNRPEFRFIHSQLENAFEQLDIVLWEFVDKLKSAYAVTDDRLHLVYLKSDWEVIGGVWYSRYEDVVDALLKFHSQHEKLVAAIKRIVPNYLFVNH